MNGRKVDLRTAEPKMSEKIAIINKTVKEESNGRTSEASSVGTASTKDKKESKKKRD